MKKTLIFAFVIIGIFWLSACSSNKTDRERAENVNMDSIFKADSIEAVKEAMEIIAKQEYSDSTQQSLTETKVPKSTVPVKTISPTDLIKRISSDSYEFTDNISDRLKSLGLNKGKTSRKDFEDYNNGDYAVITTTYSGKINGSQIKVTAYEFDLMDGDWGMEVDIDFGNDRNKEVFIEEVLKNSKAQKSGNRIILLNGNGSHIIFDTSRPSKIKVYDEFIKSIPR